MTYRPSATQQNSYSYNPIAHLAVNANLPQVISPAQHENGGSYLNHGQERYHAAEYNHEYGFAQPNTTLLSTSVIPGCVTHCTQAISSAQHGIYGFYPNHNREQQPIPEYNLGYGFVSHPYNTSSSNTGNTPGCVIRCMCRYMHSNQFKLTVPTNSTNPEFVQGSSSNIHAQFTNAPGINQFTVIGTEASYNEGPSPYAPSC